MINPNMQLLFEDLSDAFLIVTSAGEVSYANPVALKVLPISIGEPLSIEWLQGQISAIKQGYLKPPITFEIELLDQIKTSNQFKVSLLSSPTNGDFMIILREIKEENIYKTVVSNLAKIAHLELVEPMNHFLVSVKESFAKLETLEIPELGLRESIARMFEEGESLAVLIEQVVTFATVFSSTPLVDDARILVPSLIEDVIFATKALLVRKRITIYLSGINDSLPVIYGNRHLLVQALAGYLRNLAGRLDGDAKFLISALPKGNYILLTIANYEGVIPSYLQQDALPMLGGKHLGNFDHLGLSLPIIKRVIELNGGAIDIVEKDGVFVKINIELPVGAPSIEMQQTGMAQALRYAEDFHTLLQRKDNPTLQ